VDLIESVWAVGELMVRYTDAKVLLSVGDGAAEL
jgi:hypothetical protein